MFGWRSWLKSTLKKEIGVLWLFRIGINYMECEFCIIFWLHLQK